MKITGDMTISFPSGVIKVFTSNPSPAVLCFRVKNISRLEQILPNAQLVFRFVYFCFEGEISLRNFSFFNGAIIIELNDNTKIYHY